MCPDNWINLRECAFQIYRVKWIARNRGLCLILFESNARDERLGIQWDEWYREASRCIGIDKSIVWYQRGKHRGEETHRIGIIRPCRTSRIEWGYSGSNKTQSECRVSIASHCETDEGGSRRRAPKVSFASDISRVLGSLRDLCRDSLCWTLDLFPVLPPIATRRESQVRNIPRRDSNLQFYWIPSRACLRRGWYRYWLLQRDRNVEIQNIV